MMSAQKTLSRTGVSLKRHELCSDLRPGVVLCVVCVMVCVWWYVCGVYVCMHGLCVCVVVCGVYVCVWCVWCVVCVRSGVWWYVCGVCMWWCGDMCVVCV